VARVAYIAVALWWAAGGVFLLPGSEVLAAAQGQQQQDDKKAPADGAAQAPATATAAAPAADAAKPATKPKHVITNDDIKSSPYASFGGLFYTSSGSINDCNASCFDQVRNMAFVNTEDHPNWRRDVLREIEIVRSDSEWQAYMRDMYAPHGKVCQVTFDKADEMRRSGNTRNLGPQEIAITEKYDRQMQAAQADLDAAVARQSVLQKKFADKPYANAFATVQGTRMMGGFCSQARVIYPQ
jgi:hypothetical protein